MEAKLEKILFLITPGPGGRRLRIETDQEYTNRELAVLLTAFRKSLVGADPRTADRGRRRKPTQEADPPVSRVVGPGYVIERLG